MHETERLTHALQEKPLVSTPSPSETLSNLVESPIRLDENAECLLGEWGHDRTCNVFRIGNVCFDFGALSFELFWQNFCTAVSREGNLLERLENDFVFFLTHADFDHIQNAKQCIEAIEEAGGTVTIIGPVGLQGVIDRADPVETAQFLYAHFSQAKVEGFDVSAEISDGAVIQLGNGLVYCLETPGHTQRHMSYVVFTGNKLYVVLGDILGGLCEGRGSSLAHMLDQMRKSAHDLLDLIYETAAKHHVPLDKVMVLESHGYPDCPLSLSAFERQVEALVETADEMGIGFRGIFKHPLRRKNPHN